MRSSSLYPLALTVLLGLTGCQAGAPVAASAVPAATAGAQAVAAASQTGSVTATAHLRVADAKNRRLMAEVDPWVIADIHHVTVSVLAPGSTTAMQTVRVDFADLAQLVEVKGLRFSTEYTIKTRAYNDELETVAIDDSILNPESCATVFTTGTTTQTTLDGIQLKLADKAIKADGSNTIAITEGVMLTPTASETVEVLSPSVR